MGEDRNQPVFSAVFTSSVGILFWFCFLVFFTFSKIVFVVFHREFLSISSCYCLVSCFSKFLPQDAFSWRYFVSRGWLKSSSFIGAHILNVNSFLLVLVLFEIKTLVRTHTHITVIKAYWSKWYSRYNLGAGEINSDWGEEKIHQLVFFRLLF